MPKFEGYPVSRDYFIRIICLNASCFLNNNKECSSPSSISIDANGRCVLSIIEKGGL